MTYPTNQCRCLLVGVTQVLNLIHTQTLGFKRDSGTRRTRQSFIGIRQGRALRHDTGPIQSGAAMESKEMMCMLSVQAEQLSFVSCLLNQQLPDINEA